MRKYVSQTGKNVKKVVKSLEAKLSVLSLAADEATKPETNKKWEEDDNLFCSTIDKVFLLWHPCYISKASLKSYLTIFLYFLCPKTKQLSYIMILKIRQIVRRLEFFHSK